ncbi:MAG: hypothetical protein NC548_53735 [Lachnospiraceae bacterium]|nr:hypothetical protein [Lachnospiraceae bacterium]
MSKKNVDSKGRLRSVVVGFRMSSQEADLLNQLVQVSGLNKQDYLINRALQREITVVGNPKVFIGLKREITRLCDELERISSISEITDEQLIMLNQITNILSTMKN